MSKVEAEMQRGFARLGRDRRGGRRSYAQVDLSTVQRVVSKSARGTRTHEALVNNRNHQRCTHARVAVCMHTSPTLWQPTFCVRECVS